MDKNMVLHLGNGYIVDASKVIGIFDLENTTIGQDTRIFLKTQTENGDVVDVSDDIPRSFVITEDATYLCQLTVQTLRQRI
ncbi:MAG: DUF370 domain-containing protein [Oscillospiraceae bacterium]|nr:DUF370 domain-containing protein [Oscillospiraceae bacterium]MDD6085127.1 DUF370 domain-containing protein [Oscillospiraceae bacterium]